MVLVAVQPSSGRCIADGTVSATAVAITTVIALGSGLLYQSIGEPEAG